jgi:hypothetical protein
MAEEQHNNGNGKDADRADDVADNVSDAHSVFSLFACLLIIYTPARRHCNRKTPVDIIFFAV